MEVIKSKELSNYKQRDWCLTLFDVNNEQEHFNKLKLLVDEQKVKYFVLGKEICPETKKVHLQSYVYWTNARTFSAVKKDYPQAHIESRKAPDVKSAVMYCKKDGDFQEYGEEPVDKRGKVNDWADVINDVKSGTYTMEQLTEKYPEYAIRYGNGLKQVWELHRPKHQFSIEEKYGKFNPVQREIMNYVEGPTHDRQIYWVYDPVGGVGKTDLANHLISQKGFLVFGNAKTADVALAWNGEHVVFDYSRSQQEHINYGVIEDIKNGRIFSGKYQSCTKLYKRPKVLVFANFLPDYDKMSADRWYVVEVKGKKLIKPEDNLAQLNAL